MSNTKLIDQLQAEGASRTEAEALASLAKQLGSLQTPTEVKQRNWHWKWPLGVGLASGTLVAGVVMASMGTVPGEALFPVKHAVEAGQMRMSPVAREQIMMERSREVSQLVAAHKSPAIILQTLADYNQAAVGVSKASGDYPAWEYCAGQLKQAAGVANGQVKSAIDQTLNQFHLNQA